MSLSEISDAQDAARQLFRVVKFTPEQADVFHVIRSRLRVLESDVVFLRKWKDEAENENERLKNENKCLREQLSKTQQPASSSPQPPSQESGPDQHPDKTQPVPKTMSQSQVFFPTVKSYHMRKVKSNTVSPHIEKTQRLPPFPKAETKTGPTSPTSGKRELHQSYLDAFLKNDIVTMKSIKTQTMSERDAFLSKKTSIHTDRRNNVVVIGFPRDPRVNTKEQYINLLTSLDILSPSDSTHITNITQRDSKRTGKLILTISFDTLVIKQRVLANSSWSKNKYIPVWGISVFPDMTYQERILQRSSVNT